MKPLNASLKTIALVLLLIKTAIGVFFMLVNTNAKVLMWYVGQPDYLATVNSVVSLVLVVFFAAYCYIRDYMAVFYGIVWIAGIVLLIFLYQLFNPGHLGINLSFVLFVVHALTILLSEARTNRWLRIYAIALIAFWLLRAFNFYAFAIVEGILPLLFVFMLMQETKNEKPGDTEILDG
jgi:hypothetical protein